MAVLVIAVIVLGGHSYQAKHISLEQLEHVLKRHICAGYRETRLRVMCLHVCITAGRNIVDVCGIHK